MKWLHIIGISGKATANIGKEFKSLGWFVTGTDHQFLPPASTIVVDAGIPYETTYHFSHLTKAHWEQKSGVTLDINENPDLVIVVESVTDKNKEYLFAKNKGLDVRPYSQVLGEYLVKENSIVVVGTAGKTTTTSLIALVLRELGLNPSYMIGADVVDLTDAVDITDSTWSVIEGDEYFSRTLAKGAKFLEYKPKYLVITNIGYEHQDVYPTREDYINEFKKCVELVPEDGLIIANADDEIVMQVVKDAKCKVNFFSERKDEDVFYPEIFDLVPPYPDEIAIKFNEEKLISTDTMLIGKFYPLDFTIVTALFNSLFVLEKLGAHFKFANDNKVGQKFGLNQTLGAIFKNFHGVKKRLEILYKSDDLVVIDDFGVAPNRAKNSLETLKDEFPDFEIVAIFEPNSGSRPKDEEVFKDAYANVFDKASEVIIPELSKFNEELANESDFVKWLSELNVTVKQVDTAKINDYLQNAKIKMGNKKLLIVFFSAYRLDSIAKEFVHGL